MDEWKVDKHTDMDHKIPQIHQQQLLFNDLDGTFRLILIACLNQNQSQQFITSYFTVLTLHQTQWLHVFYTICIGWLSQFLLPPHWIVEIIGEDFLSVDFVSLTTPASINYQDISLINNIHAHPSPSGPPPPIPIPSIWSFKFPNKDHCHLILPDQYT